MKRIILVLAAVLLMGGGIGEAQAETNFTGGAAFTHGTSGATVGQSSLTGYFGPEVWAWHDGKVKLWGFARHTAVSGGNSGWGGEAVLGDNIKGKWWALLHGGAVDKLLPKEGESDGTKVFAGIGIARTFGHALHLAVYIDGATNVELAKAATETEPAEYKTFIESQIHFAVGYTLPIGN